MLKHEDDLRDLRRRWRTFEMLALAERTGILGALAPAASSAKEVADKLHLDERVTRAVLIHLAAARLLETDEERFVLPSAGRAVVQAFMEMAHEHAEAQGFESLLRTGQPLNQTVSGVALDDAQDRARFLTGLYRRSGPGLAAALDRARRCPGVATGRILDLGGGHGAFAEAFSRAFPEASVTLFDQSVVEVNARRLAGDGFRFLGGDFHRDALGGPYELVWLSNVVSCETDQLAVRLLGRVREALVSDGTLVIRDRCLDDAAPPTIELTDFGLILAAGTAHGQVRSFAHVRRLLSRAEFTTVAFEPGDGDYTHVIARR